MGYHIKDEKYLKEVHGEINRCRDLCYQINHTSPIQRDKILELEQKLFNHQRLEGTFFTPPLQIDVARQVILGKNVFVNHGLSMMSVGTVVIEDGVMIGPDVGLFTVNHDFDDIRIINTKEIHLKENAWIGARVNILPGVTIGKGSIIGTGSVVTKDIPDYCLAVGNPARVIKHLKEHHDENGL